jgi:hypothetical protein
MLSVKGEKVKGDNERHYIYHVGGGVIDIFLAVNVTRQCLLILLAKIGCIEIKIVWEVVYSG